MIPPASNVIHAMMRFVELRSAWRRSLGRALEDKLGAARARVRRDDDGDEGRRGGDAARGCCRSRRCHV